MLLILISSCGLKLSLKNNFLKKNNTIISGVISPLAGSISSDHSYSLLVSTANAIGCADPVYAKIFTVKTDGSIDESNPLASQLVTAGARYSFDGDDLGLKKEDNVHYLIKAEGCNNDIYKRPVTDFNDKQNLDAKTTIVSEVVNANTLVSTTLNNAKRVEVEALIESMSGTSIPSALTSITTEVDPVTKFTEIFGVSPSVIQNGKPSVQLNPIPNTLNELQTHNFSAQAYHIDPNYSFAYSWKINGVVKSHSSIFNYTPGPNESGVKTIDFYAGKDDGNGNIDLSKPYYSKTITMLVNNSSLPTPPNITLNSANPTPVNTTTVNVDLATGVSFAQCATFSHLAITDTSAVPNAGQFMIDCSTSGTQTETVTFSNGDGLKTLYIWAIDNEGHISTPKTLNLILDTLPPVANLVFTPTIVKGNSSQTITLSGSDAGVGLATLALYFSSTGSNPYTLVSNLSLNATSYTWTTPSIDIVTGKLKVVATDLTGLETTAYSGTIAIDSTVPTAPAITRTSSATSNSTTVALSATCILDYDKIIYSESSTTPLINAAGWENCAATKNFTVSTGDGSKTIYAWTKDLAGNISSSSSVTMTLDATPPTAPVATLSSSAIASSSTLTFTIASCLDRPNILVSESSSTPAAGDSSWQTCSTTTSAIAHTLSGPTAQGTHNLYVFAKDSVGNISSSTSFSMIFDSTSPTLSLSTTLASIYKGGDVIALSFAASDTNGLASLKLEYAADGSTYSLVSNLSTSATTYNWTVPNGNTTTGKLKLTAIDNATTANSEVVTSSTFTIDSTAPTAPVISRTSSAASNSTTVVLSATCIADYDKIIYSESSTTPLLGAAGWEACAGTKNFTVSSSDGSKTIYAWTRDLAGNISTSSNVTMTLDTTAPSAPVANLSSSSITSSLALTFTVTDCLDRPSVFVSESIIAPAANDSSWQTCSTTASAITYSLIGPAVQGTHNLYVFAKDSVGNISLPTLSSVVYDTTKPTISLSTTLAALYKGGDVVTLNFSATDTNGVASIKLEYASDGATFTTVTTLAGTATTYNWTIPASNTVNAKIKLTATDNSTTANTETTTSNAFAIDSTAPSAPLLTRTSGSLTNATLVAMTITSCSDIDMVYVNESSIAPSGSNPGWVACSTAASNYSVTVNGQGLHTIYSWAKDAAGNISTSSNITMTLDTVLPAITITAAPTALRSNTSTGNISWTLTEANVAASTTFNVEIYNGSAWSTLSTPSANSGLNTSQAYSLTNFAVPNVNTGAAKVRITLVDAAGNSSTATTSDFIIDGLAPVISSVIINDNATYAGTSIVGVKVNVTDNVSTGSQIKIRLSLSNTSTDSCQTEYADNGWVSWTNANTEFSFAFGPSDGVKKICAWAKDLSGNISIISPAMGVAGVDYDTIIYSAGNVPQITAFSVARTSDSGRTATLGQPLTITWSASDVEGLDNNPVSISYTTDNATWKDITTNLTIDTRSNMTWVGSLSSNPTTGSGSITAFTAPSSSYFRVRAQVRDIAGNTSLLAFSQPFNTGAWNVYAGTKHRGDGGTGRAATFVTTGWYNHFAINPKNGDMYATDNSSALRKLDAKTGIVSTFLKTTGGVTNLSSTGGAIPANPVFPINSYVNPTFDNKGRLYLGYGSSGGYTNTIIYQIDLEAMTSRIYAGGGTDNDGGGLPSALSIAGGGYNFDEENSLYVWSMCNNGTAITTVTYTTIPFRIIKITQNSDGTAGTTTRIIGDCTFGNITSGVAAVNQPAMPGAGSNIGITSSIIPWDNGNKILVLPSLSTAKYKIINGIAYSTSITSSGGFGKYNPVDGYVYKMNGTGAEKILVNTSGANGDTVTSYFNANATAAGCTLDGVTPSTYCGAKYNLQIHAGVPYFTDGSISNGESVATIRYFDSSSKLRTIFGSTPFYGDGLNKSLMRGTFSGIYYKKSSEDNLAAFPEGLYFVEPTGMVLGYINPTTGIASALWGNQSRIATTPVTGKVISKDFSMGHTYTYNGKPLNFDSHGLPWLRTNNDVVSIDENKKIVRYTDQTLGNGYMQNAANGADPSKYGLMVNVGAHNFPIKNKGLFIIPTYVTTGVDPIITLRLMDFDNLVAPIVLGGNYLSSENKAASPDLLTPGTVAAAPLWTSCKNNGVCYMQYNATNDRLYYSEGLVMRYITTPDNTSTATLRTLFTITGSNISNFRFNTDGSQLWYFRANGGLYCYDISSGKSWCDNTTDHFTIRTASGLSIISGPDQITFKDNQTMFVSTYGGEILQFDLPTGP